MRGNGTVLLCFAALVPAKPGAAPRPKPGKPLPCAPQVCDMHGRAYPLRPSRSMLLNGAIYRGWDRCAPQLRTVHDSIIAGARSVHHRQGGASLLALCTVARPSPGTSPLITPHPFNAEPSRAHDPGQIEPYLEPSRDEALRVGSREGRAVQDRLLPGSLVQ